MGELRPDEDKQKARSGLISWPASRVSSYLNDGKLLVYLVDWQLFSCVLYGTHSDMAVEGLQVKPDYLLVDGNIFRDFDFPGESVIKGDATSSSIAAASILAKVTRDLLCDELDALYPEYGIKQHKGYGTKAHMDALRKYGPTPCHRKQFIRFLDKNTL